MTVILILAPGPGDERVRDRVGDAFDNAFVETLRTLDAQGVDAPVLAPWSNDLAPLVAAALIDTAPSFDPEGGGSRAETSSRIIPYLVAPDDFIKDEAIFWRATHLSLGRGAPLPLGEVLETWRPTHVVLLGLPEDTSELVRAIGGRDDVAVLVFSGLMGREDAALRLDLSIDRVIDLEARLAKFDDDGERTAPSSSLEEAAEAELEPYVPYGLLLQEALADFLPRERPEGDLGA